MNNLLAVTFVEFIQRPNVIIGIVLAVLGIALAILARRITRAIRKTKDVQNNDNVLIGFKVAGLVLILVGFILMIIEF